MQWTQREGIGVVLVSWWGIYSFEGPLAWEILHTADNYHLKVGFYVEPYGGGYERTSGYIVVTARLCTRK